MNIEKNMHHLTLFSLVLLGVAMLTSTSLVGLVHIFLAIPCLYFMLKGTDRTFTASMLALMGLIVVMILSVFFNLDLIDNPSRNFSRIRYFIFGLLSVFAFRSLFANYIQQKHLVWAWRLTLLAVTVGTIAGLIGLWTGFNPIRMMEAHHRRNMGLFSMLMTYAYGLSLFMVIMTGLLLYQKRIFSALDRSFFFVAYGLNLLGLYLTYTRGAWLGFILGAPFLLFKNHKKVFSIILVSISLITALAVMILPRLDSQVRIFQSGSDSARIAFYQAAWAAAKERPLLGYGYRNFEPHILAIKERHPEIGHPQRAGHAHNNFFEILATTGFIGAFLFVLFKILWIRELYLRDDLVGKLGFAFVISFTISGLFQFTWGDAPITLMLMGVYALSQIPVGSFERLILKTESDLK